MFSLTRFGRYLERRSRMKGYEATRSELEQIPDADLADMGVKRYQLGHAARVRSLR